jgi:hypothetical protein
MIAKLGIVEEEADETLYWLEVLAESGLAQQSDVQPLQRETHQLLAMIVQSRKTLRSRLSAAARSAEIENRKSKIQTRQLP